MDLTKLLISLSSGEAEVSWDAWWVFATAVDRDPEVLIRSWQEMPESAQMQLLNRLAAEAEPVADYLVRVLARSLPPGVAPEIRRIVVDDAADAGGRQVERLRMLRDKLADELMQQSTEEVDITVEIENLKRDCEVRRAAIEADPNYSVKEELENEISRLEAFRNALENYDREERVALLRALKDETDDLAAKRLSLEEQIRTAMEYKNQAQRAVGVRSAELARLSESNSQVESEIVRLKQAAEMARALSESAMNTAAAVYDVMGDSLRQLNEISQQCDQARVCLVAVMVEAQNHGGAGVWDAGRCGSLQAPLASEGSRRAVLSPAENYTGNAAQAETPVLPSDRSARKSDRTRPWPGRQ